MPNLGPDAGQTKKELDRAARITEADIQSAKAAWRRDTNPGPRRLLDAKPRRVRRRP